MSPTLEDLVAADELFDPRFSWPLLPGFLLPGRGELGRRVRHRLEGLDVTTIGSSLTTRRLLPNNTYYWRVRAVDAHGHEGDWNVGATFQKSFADETVMGRTSVTNLRMLYPDADSASRATRRRLRWSSGIRCPAPRVTTWRWEAGPAPRATTTARSKQSPRRPPGRRLPPLPPATARSYSTTDFPTPAHDSLKARSAGAAYCVRVRPRDKSHSSTGDGDRTVVGTFTELNGGSFSFDWTAYPTGGACSPSCNPGYIGADDYVAPIKGSTVGSMPLFRWNPVAGAASYFIVIARDSGFTTVVDYAFSRIPAYAPRRGHGNTQSRTYSDETTKFYWVVLPSPNLNGSAAASPAPGAASDFLKQTTPPTLLAPADGAHVAVWPTFSWTPVHGARTYEIQVDDSSTFASPVDTKRTNSTAYTSETTYEADKVLYWRVRPIDDTNTALTWSETRTFQRSSRSPSGTPDFPPRAPRRRPSPGSRLRAQSRTTSPPISRTARTSSSTTFRRRRSRTYFYGIGVFGQRVRANFPSTSGSPTHGPWSTTHDFTRTIPAPANPIASVSKTGLSFSWSPRAEAREYRIQVSKTSDFERPVETVTTDNTVYAPTMTTSGYLAGGAFYWRVAAVDEGRNVGQYSPANRITLRKGMRLSAGAPSAVSG